MQELSQLQALAGMVPVVFLCVAAFLINMVLGRLIRLQRPELATLKAIGYSNREVGLHYLALVVVVILPGNLLGVLGGWGLGRAVMVPYARAFRFPDLGFSLSPSLIVSALVASSVAATLGALGAVRSAVKLPPAEAMRPPAPARYRRGLSERLGLDAFLGPSGLMVLREIQRRPLRTLTSSLGIAVRRNVSYHGLALNVSTDLSYFRLIQPCGFASAVMTNMAENLAQAPDFAAVSARLERRLAEALAPLYRRPAAPATVQA